MAGMVFFPKTLEDLRVLVSQVSNLEKARAWYVRKNKAMKKKQKKQFV